MPPKQTGINHKQQKCLGNKFKGIIVKRMDILLIRTSFSTGMKVTCFYWHSLLGEGGPKQRKEGVILATFSHILACICLLSLLEPRKCYGKVIHGSMLVFKWYNYYNYLKPLFQFLMCKRNQCCKKLILW